MEFKIGSTEGSEWSIAVTGTPTDIARVIKLVQDSKVVTFKPNDHPAPTPKRKSRKGGRRHQKWTQEEENTLFYMLNTKGYTVSRCARALERTKAGVKIHVHKLGWKAK